MKKFLGGFIIVICMSILALSLVIMAANKGYLNKPIKKVVTRYLHHTGHKVSIGDLHIKNSNLAIDEMVIELDSDTKAKLQNIHASFSIPHLTTKPLVISNVDIPNISIISTKTNQVILDTKINSTNIINFAKNTIDTSLNIDAINMVNILDSYGNNLPTGKGSCNYKRTLFTDSKVYFNCNLFFDETANLEFSSTLHENHLQANGSARNIPILFYQFAEKIMPDNAVTLYLQEHIKGGYLRKGEFNVDCDISQVLEQNLLLEKDLKAKLHIVDLEYKYDLDFPALKKIDTDVTISGYHVDLVVNEAYSSNSSLTGSVTFDWKGVDSSVVIVNLLANGTTSDLIDFIPIEEYDNTKKQGIDLKNLTGNAQTTVKLKIPISPDIKNSYDVTSSISNVNGTAFNNNIILKNAAIKGTFDGNKVNLTGAGRLNDFDSKFTYIHNMSDQNSDDYKFMLQVQSNIIADQQKIGILKLISGRTNLNFEFKRKKTGENLINMKSNLKDLEFYLDKIAISKKMYKEAFLNVTGKLQDSSNGTINFSLAGEDDLKIVANAGMKAKKIDVVLPSIRHNNTNLTGKIFVNADSLSAEIKGSSLDLAQSDMMQFLEKEAEARNTHLKVDIDRVSLKNGVWLDNLSLKIDCNKLKCFSGSLDSKIGTKTFKMLLVDQKDMERWIISCDNAGALLKGVGMYNNMKSGVLNLTLDTKRHEVKKGEIIPILDGKFSINKFVATDASFLARMASFVSFPGFLSAIVNNKNIMFNEMKGEFSYIGNIIKVKDTSATGPFFDFTMKGTIDTTKRKIKLKGSVTPSFFLVGSIITKIPVAGKIFSKVSAAPYSLEMDYK